MGEYKNSVLPRVESHFKEVKKFPQTICVNDYSSLYIASLENYYPYISYGPNDNTKKFVIYNFPFGFFYLKGIRGREG